MGQHGGGGAAGQAGGHGQAQAQLPLYKNTTPEGTAAMEESSDSQHKDQ